MAEESTENSNETEKTTYYSDSDVSQMEDAFIMGKNAVLQNGHNRSYSHYKEVFAAFRKGRIIKWNWSNFLFAGIHLLYRKQYMWGFLSLAASIVCIKFPVYYLIQAMAFGLFGDYLLYQKFCGICDDGVEKYDANVSSMCAVMRKKGGTNVLISILVSVFVVILLVIIALIVWGVGNLAGLIAGLFS